MRVTNPRIPLTILGLAASCALVLAIHPGQAGSRLATTISSRIPGGSSGSQWHWQNPLPQGNTLRGASFVDANTGTVVGDYGTIVRTTDGGNSWTVQASGTTQDLWPFPSQMQITERLWAKPAPSLGPQMEVLIGSRKQAAQLFSFVESRSPAVQLMERLLAKVAPFLGPQTAETAGFPSQVEPRTLFSGFHSPMRTPERPWVEPLGKVRF